MVIKLVNTFPDGWQVDTGSELVPLNKFCRSARIKAGMTMDRLNIQSGLGHPTVNNYESGKYRPLPAMITALMTLGYEVEIKSPEVKSG